MTTKNSGSPPTLSEDDKFDGSNYTEWAEKILMACRVRGARGYLEGRIKQPSPEVIPLPSSPGSPAVTLPETSWSSPNPSWEEWDARDAWCLLAICQNVKNPVGIGLKTDGSAAEAWDSLVKRYKISTDLARVFAQRELRSTIMREGENFSVHIADLHTKHKRANSVGANINDADFREIILASLPQSWDPVISTLSASESSIDTIIRLEMQWTRVMRHTKTSLNSATATAFKASTTSGKPRLSQEEYEKKKCTNCKRKGHLLEDCYWPGGGKEGKFPPGFRMRGGATGSAIAAATVPTTHLIANTAVVETAYALLAEIINPAEDLGPEYDDMPGLIPAFLIHPDDVGTPNPSCATPDTDPAAEVANMAYTVTAIPTMLDARTAMAMKAGEVNIGVDTVTYADSGASNHCFVNKCDFSTYEEYAGMREGQAASKSARFKIHGKGTVTKNL